MPLYEYRCQECDERFELRRTFADADIAALCPAGHDAAVRLLPVFSSVGRSAGPAPSGVSAPKAGPCGSACGCHH